MGFGVFWGVGIGWKGILKPREELETRAPAALTSPR